jgi:hypothetical protein
MLSPSLPEVLMQITDGHAARAAELARERDRRDSYPAVEQLARIAILRRAQENALRSRVFGAPTAVRAGAARHQPAGEGRG